MPEIQAAEEIKEAEAKPVLEPAPKEAAKPAKPKGRRRLKVAHPERCIGCLSCMFACSRTRTGTVSLQNSAIKVQTQGGIEGDFRVVVCRGCQDPPCARACPTGAMEKRPNGSVVFHKDRCTGCGNCEKACLVGAVTLNKDKKPIKCIHCGECVDFCPHGVLELEEVSASGG
ncbi:MAG: 4Fe-4S dicluster domain-containing protein [Methanothrix sp.]